MTQTDNTATIDGKGLLFSLICINKQNYPSNDSKNILQNQRLLQSKVHVEA
jgi:hypothetical protein